MGKTAIGIEELVDIICSSDLRIRKIEARKWIDTVFGTIEDVLLSGDNVRIKNFGTFCRRKRKAMTGYNPYTGGEIEIAETNSVAFVPAKDLKSRIN